MSTQWGSLFSPDKVTSLALLEFDKAVEERGQSCFSLQVNSNFGKEMEQNFMLIANDSVVLRKQVDVSKNQLISECVSADYLGKEDNFVQIFLGSERVFFHVAKVAAMEESNPQVLLEYLQDEILGIRITGNNNAKYSPGSIFVNGKLDHAFYFSGETFEGKEKISLQQGSNSIKVVFRGAEKEIFAEKAFDFRMNPFLGIAIIAVLICVLAGLVFFGNNLFEKLVFSILSFFSIICLVVFTLNVLGLLSALNFSIAIAVIALALGFFFRKNLAKNKALEINWAEKVKKVSPLLILLLCIILFSSIFFNLFTPTYFGVWTSFYERQSRTIMENQAIPAVDSYSFLGTKPFGYMSGYFFANPGISWLTGLGTQQSYAIIMLLAQLSFLGAGYLFFSSFGIGKKAYLGMLAVLFGGFMFSDFSFNIRHVLSYAFLFISMYFLRNGKGLASGVALGFGTFFQTPIAIMYLFMLPVIVTDRKTLKEIAKAIAVGALIAAVFFAPTLVSSGLPSQAKYNVWGYFWSIPLYGFLLDYYPMLVLIGLFILPFLLLKKISLGKYNLRIILFLLLFLAVQLTISYRINIVATITFALLVSLLFPADFLKGRLGEYSIATFFAVAYTVMFVVILAFYPVIPAVSDSFVFVKDNSSANSNVLNEPYLGHPFIYFAERKSSADLAVEYANAAMIDDSYRFLKEQDKSILQKYNIDYVVNRSMFLDEKPVGDNLYSRHIEFEFLDKVYSNSLVYVHWVDKQSLGVVK
jgi:hypothetical protein